MRILTIRIETDSLDALERAGQQFAEAWRHGDYAGEVMSFESPTALFRLITPARWGILSALQKEGPCGIRALARVIKRDPSAVLRDIAILSERGLVKKDNGGKLFVPFSRIHAEFDLLKAA